MTLELRLKSIKAKDLMTKFAITASEEETAEDLANLFMRFKISGVPVLDDRERIKGVVTATDLFRHMEKIVALVDDGKDVSKEHVSIPLGRIMSQPVKMVTEETSLYEMIKLMCDKDIHTLPVVRDGTHMVGVVGRRDVISAFYSAVSCSQKT